MQLCYDLKREEKMNKKVLIVNYAGLGMGGVETYLYSLMLAAKEAKYRVIWITTKGNQKSAVFRDVADNPDIEKAYMNMNAYFLGMGRPKLDISADEEVTMVSFNQENYLWGEYFRKKYHCKSFDHFFVLMNFFGESTYPEDRNAQFSYFKKKRKKLSEKIAPKLAEDDCIRAFAQKQLIYYKDRYNLDISTSKDKCLKSYTKIEVLTDEELNQKANERREQFSIAICSRFDFPHKGYMVGMLGEFEKIHNKYPQTKLFVIGEGGSKPELMKKYDSLSEKAKNAIEFVGTLQPEELDKFYRKCHLTVSLAGCALSSARIGVPTLVARHSTYDCEVYGFMHEAKSTLREDLGEPVFPYIEKAITYSAEEYVKTGKLGADFLNQGREYDPLYILKEKSKSSKPIASKWDIFVSSICYTMSSVYRKVFR